MVLFSIELFCDHYLNMCIEGTLFHEVVKDFFTARKTKFLV